MVRKLHFKSSKSVDSSSESECDLEDAEFEKYLIKKLKKMLKNKKAKKDGNNKAPYKTKFVSEKNTSKGSTKPIQCFECQGYGHVATKCANRKEISKGKALNVSWEEDTDEEKSEPESPDNDFKDCVAFMALSTVSSLQGSSDRESKSNDNSDSDNLSSPQQIKTKAVWIRTTDLNYNVVYTAMSKSIENAEVDPPPRKLLGIGLHP